MKLKVFTAALMAILLSVVFSDTAEAQGRGNYNRGRGGSHHSQQGSHYNNYNGGNYARGNYNGGYYNRGNNCAPRGYVRSYAPAYYNGGGYYNNGYGGGYTTTTVTYSVNGRNRNNGYYNNGYNNGGYYNNGNCGNGYRRESRRGW